jgi:hypothetical protein
MKQALVYSRYIGFGVALLFFFFLQNQLVTAYHTCTPLTGDDYNTCMTDPNNAHSVQNPGGSVQNPGGSVQNPGACTPGQLCNPLQSSTVQEFLLKIIDILLIFALPIIIFFIMYAGYLFVTARGNESQITEARTALTWALIGGVIILGARAIITVIQGTVDAL